MPLVAPLPAGHGAWVAELAVFFETTLGLPPNSISTMPRRPAVAKAFVELKQAVMTNEGRLTHEKKRLDA